MKKISPKYSKSKVNQAGKILITDLSDIEIGDWVHAFDVMDNWRASHVYPINTFQANLRTKIKKRQFKNTIVVQRLKRVPSIISKLERNPTMNLARMQDLGGLRVILTTVNQVNIIKSDFIRSKFRHKLVREYNYIETPKPSGYRGIHLVYKYFNGRAPEYDGLQVEVQLRTKLQHAWATSVETMGTFLDHSLKSSEGPKDWLEFFSLCGSAFAYLESCPAAYEYKDFSEQEITDKLIKIEKNLNIIDSLKAFGSTIKAIEDRKMNFKYYLLILNILERKVSYEGYYANDLNSATKSYKEHEKMYEDQSNTQIVLVSGDSFKMLKRAYPNYFLDTHEFTVQLKRLFTKYG